jgi:ubiquinone/menaquinone biosynthesis C-methylase UbiE
LNRELKPSGQEFSSVEAHYHHQGLEADILAALVAAGKDPDHLKPEDLAPIDEFHIRGRKATLELAREISPVAGSRVLDVGSGLGGPSRCLALEFGCHVTGIDLNAEYCQVAGMLARRLGLDSLVSYVHGNALDMPFEDATFDLLWTQHMAMNIADKDALYSEMWRVLKPGGKLAIYDALGGVYAPVHFPVPWAREPSASFLLSPQQLLNTLESIGFEVLSWQDTTEIGRSWFRHLEEKIRTEGPPPLGIHLLLGSDFGAMSQNQVRNLDENRIALIEAVVQRPVYQCAENHL